MRVTFLMFLTSLAVQVTPAFGQASQSLIERPVSVTIRFASGDTVTFRSSQRVVTDIDLHVRSSEHTVPLQCAGGLHDVRAETAALTGNEGQKTEGTFALLFEMGNEQDRRFGKLPRVQLSFYRRRLTEMLVATMTGETSSFWSKLCTTVPPGPVTCRDTRQLQGLHPDALVEQLRDLPTPLPNGFNDTERRRRNIYEELLDWGAQSLPSLISGLRDPDVRLRRNAVLALGVLSGGWWPFECGPAKVDISSALSTLVIAFRDPDRDVRAWAARAAGNMGPHAVGAVPDLIELLESADEGARNSACAALGQIGPPAKAALPALRAALFDASPDVRRFAARAIQRIEQK
jgi:hypothetical protein